MTYPNFAILHGCFGRDAGGASFTTNFHSNEWTLVRDRQNKGKKPKMSKSNFGICQWITIPSVEVNFEVAPKENNPTYHSARVVTTDASIKMPKGNTPNVCRRRLLKI
jgi:hypothetical protein